MGKDIHINIEYRNRKTRKICHGGDFVGDRIYDFFSILAGNINHNERALFPLRGLPGDVSRSVYEQYKENEHLCAGYVTTSELKECIDETKSRFGYGEEDDCLQNYGANRHFEG